jgi:hypothetical protein
MVCVETAPPPDELDAAAAAAEARQSLAIASG